MADTGAFEAQMSVKPVSQLATATDLKAKFDSLERGRQLRERQWKLNLAFYRGRQYTYYSKTLRRLQTLPTDDGDKPRYRVRLVSNQIVPGCMSLMSKMLKTKPQMHATPGSGSDSDLKAAETSEALLEYWWDDFQLDDALEEVLLWSMIAGQGYWKITWDDQAGKSMTFTLDPDGNPVMDENLIEMFKVQLEQAGYQRNQQDKTVYVGDIRVETLSAFDLFPDPTVKRFKDAKYVIQRMYLDPDEVYARWGIQVTPDAIPGAEDASVPNGTTDRQTDKSVKKVFMGYFKPTPTMPQGRIVTWIDSRIVEDKAWDLPTTQLPFVKFPGLRIPGDVYDDAIVTHAIPLQKELNRTLSQIIEFKNLGVKPQWTAPAGSLRQRRTDEPGAIFEFNPINGFKPEPIPVPGLPAYVFEHLAGIKQRIDELFGRMEVSEGGVPPNVEAGIAIDLLQEMATDKIAPQIRLIEMALEQAGQQMLALAQEYYIEPRLMKIMGGNGQYKVKQFSNADIKGDVTVHVETGSGLPRTRAGRQARIESFIQMGILRPDQAWRYLDTADLHGLGDQFAADEDQAYREHELLDAGQPLNNNAMQQCQQQIQQVAQQGINPESGQPFQSPEEFQQWAQQTYQQCMATGGPADNHSTHMDVHARVMKGWAYRQFPLEVQAAYEAHYGWHQQMMQDSIRPDPQSVRTSLQLRGAVTPSEASAILSSNGVPISPEQAAEPPTETWVAEQVPPGYNPDGSQEQNAAPELRETLAVKNADVREHANLEHQQAIAAAQAQADLLGKAQQASHAEDLHNEKLRQASASADAAEAKARQANNPQPPTGGR